MISLRSILILTALASTNDLFASAFAPSSSRAFARSAAVSKTILDAHTLVLLRHGESTWNNENKFTGWVDVPLSEKGEKEARAQDGYRANGGKRERSKAQEGRRKEKERQKIW